MFNENTFPERLLKFAARRFGYSLYRNNRGPSPWSHTVEDYYPIDLHARWGKGREPFESLHSVLDKGRATYEEFIEKAERAASLIRSVPVEPDSNISKPFWNNKWFTSFDAVALITMLEWQRPSLYLEIGSGTSTMFARNTISELSLPTRIISIDPNPRKEIDRLCDEVIRAPLEKANQTIFSKLSRGDILFYDGSRRMFTNSDVTVFFLEILPMLKSGVMVHVHDIFLPNDYPTAWNGRLYNEQYILAAMLLQPNPKFRVVAPVHFMCQDKDLSRRISELFASVDGSPEIPFFYPNDARSAGASFWIETL